MKYDEETIKAAEEYAAKQFFTNTALEGFLSGFDHRQPEVDELVALLEYTKSAFRAISSMGATVPIIERIDNGIKKHQR